jgi:hypothetical protein
MVNLSRARDAAISIPLSELVRVLINSRRPLYLPRGLATTATVGNRGTVSRFVGWLMLPVKIPGGPMDQKTSRTAKAQFGVPGLDDVLLGA